MLLLQWNQAREMLARVEQEAWRLARKKQEAETLSNMSNEAASEAKLAMGLAAQKECEAAQLPGKTKQALYEMK